MSLQVLRDVTSSSIAQQQQQQRQHDIVHGVDILALQLPLSHLLCFH